MVTILILRYLVNSITVFGFTHIEQPYTSVYIQYVSLERDWVTERQKKSDVNSELTASCQASPEWVICMIWPVLWSVVCNLSGPRDWWLWGVKGQRSLALPARTGPHLNLISGNHRAPLAPDAPSSVCQKTLIQTSMWLALCSVWLAQIDPHKIQMKTHIATAVKRLNFVYK